MLFLAALVLPLAAAAPHYSLLPRAANGTATGAAGGAAAAAAAGTTQLTFTGAGVNVAVTATVDGKSFQLRRSSLSSSPFLSSPPRLAV